MTRSCVWRGKLVRQRSQVSPKASQQKPLVRQPFSETGRAINKIIRDEWFLLGRLFEDDLWGPPLTSQQSFSEEVAINQRLWIPVSDFSRETFPGSFQHSEAEFLIQYNPKSNVWGPLANKSLYSGNLHEGGLIHGRWSQKSMYKEEF